MECVYKEFYTSSHVQAVRQFLEIISANSIRECVSDDMPVILKEGYVSTLICCQKCTNLDLLLMLTHVER